MKDFMKYAAIGMAGYLIGFYEMKYKTVKAIAEGYIKHNENESKEEEES